MSDQVEHTHHIRIHAIGRDRAGLIYIWLIVTRGARPSNVIVPIHSISRPTAVIENELILVSPAARSELQRRVQARANETPTFPVVTRGGWFGRRYVFPDGTFIDPQDRDPFVRLPDPHQNFAAKFRASGDIAAWREICQLARGNTRLMLGIGTALSGPIVDWLGLEAPAFQLTDPGTGVGKSTIAEVAASAWGGRENGHYAEAWSHTPHYIELCAKAHHAAFLVLDDLRTFKFSVHGFAGFDEVLMCLANGIGRGRLTDVEAVAQFRTPLLSTANADLISTAARFGLVADDALLVRLIDISLPPGLGYAFENLHGRASHVDFSIDLRQLAGRARGKGSEHFVRGLERLRARDDAEAARFVRNERARCIRLLNSRVTTSGRDLSRFHERFATTYGTMAAAIRIGTVDWSLREAFDAVLACAEAHVELVARARSSVGPRPLVNPLERLTRHVADNRDRFPDAQKPIVDPAHDHDACPGYISVHDGHPEYFFAEAQWRRICGPAAASAKETLQQRDLLHSTAARPSTRRVLRIAGRRERVQVIAVKAVFFEQASDSSR